MKKIFLLVLILATCVCNFSTAQVFINEGTNRNYSSRVDEDGEYPDWIELFNSANDTADLYNFSLTDDTANITQWTFPHISMLPGTFKTVFCSGKDRKPVSGFLNVAYDTAFNAVVGWNTHNFSTPFYWDGISNILINVCSYSNTGYTTNSVFNMTTTAYPSVVFGYQDGSAASCGFQYGTISNDRPNMKFNGHTVGTGNVQNCNTCYPAPYGNWYWGAKNQMLVRASELTAAGVTAGMINNLSFSVAATDVNTIYTWIDINMKLVTENQVTSSFVAVDPNNNQHTNFKIPTAGKTIYLYSPAQQQVSHLFVNVEQLDNSVGSFPDSSNNIVLFGSATPAASNNNSTPFTSYLIPPSFNIPSGFYTTVQSVSIFNPNPAADSAIIYYTTNGNDPTIYDSVYHGTPVPIFFSCALKAKCFNNHKLPSTITNYVYFFGVNHTTPILSVVTDNANLYGPNGIFDNWWTDWQRPAVVEYFDSTQQLIFASNAAVQIDGGAGGSRSQPQHSFRVEMNNPIMGDGAIYNEIIPNRPNRIKYSSFYLRNGSNQYLELPYKDAAQEEMMCGATNTYYSAWRPISVYVNGNYFGLYELREKFDTDYFTFQDSANNDSTSILSLSYWYGGVLRGVLGSVDSFYDNYNSFLNLNVNNPNFWNQADRYFDMQYYNDYVMSESWMANVDWPWNNIKIYRSDKTDYRWRFCTVDMELAQSPNGWTDCYYDHINYLLGGDPNIPYINIFLRCIQNDRFRNYFINRFADLMNTVYDTSRILPIENKMFNQTVVEMQKEYNRWGNGNLPAQMSDFFNNHQVFRDQLSQRTTYVRNNIINNFLLPNPVDLTLDVLPAGAGKIHISTIEPTTYPWTGVYFNGVPVKIEAIPNPGFHFMHWGNNGLVNDTLNSLWLDTLQTFATNFTAYFDVNVGVNELPVSGFKFQVYPNPAKDMLNVDLSSLKNESVSINVKDIYGKEVLSATTSIQHPTFNIQHLSAGIYFIEVKTKEGSAVRKFVKE